MYRNVCKMTHTIINGEDKTMPYSWIRFGWFRLCMAFTSFTKSSKAPGWASASALNTLTATFFCRQRNDMTLLHPLDLQLVTTWYHCAFQNPFSHVKLKVHLKLCTTICTIRSYTYTCLCIKVVHLLLWSVNAIMINAYNKLQNWITKSFRNCEIDTEMQNLK